MAETVKLAFDDGWRTVQLGDDPNRVIRINPTDTGFMKRFSELGDNAKKISEKYGDVDLSQIAELKYLDPNTPDFDKLKAAAESIDKIDRAIRELIDTAFGQPISDAVFGETWCLSPVHGEPMYMHFLDVIGEYIASEIGRQNKQSAEKISKYTAAAKSAPKFAKNKKRKKR